jgi:hypothetical protein
MWAQITGYQHVNGNRVMETDGEVWFRRWNFVPGLVFRQKFGLSTPYENWQNFRF